MGNTFSVNVIICIILRFDTMNIENRSYSISNLTYQSHFECFLCYVSETLWDACGFVYLASYL